MTVLDGMWAGALALAHSPLVWVPALTGVIVALAVALRALTR